MDGPVTAPLDDGLLQYQESRSVAPPKNFVYQIHIKIVIISAFQGPYHGMPLLYGGILRIGFTLTLVDIPIKSGGGLLRKHLS